MIFIVAIFSVLLASSPVEGCKKTCDLGKGIKADLRPFFTTCMRAKVGRTRDWSATINFIVWNDVWYFATDTFFCKNQNASCWIKHIPLLLKPKSNMNKPLRKCIEEYRDSWQLEGSGDGPGELCEPAEKPVYKEPIQSLRFPALKSCPAKKFNYRGCMEKTLKSITQKALKSNDAPYIVPVYKLEDILTFLMIHRSDCRITSLFGSKSFVSSCPGTASQITSSIGTLAIKTQSNRALIRTTRAINFSLKDLLSMSEGGRINFLVSSSGQSVVMPSKPLSMKPKSKKVPKCLAIKLQSVLRSDNVVYSAAARCNKQSLTPSGPTVQVSAMIRIKPKIEWGSVGECGPGDVWSPWYNRDKPDTGSGDNEYFSWIRNKNRGELCLRPSAVQARLVKNQEPYYMARQKVKIEPLYGLSCINYKQKDRKCEDYEVRFCCPNL